MTRISVFRHRVCFKCEAGCILSRRVKKNTFHTGSSGQKKNDFSEAFERGTFRPGLKSVLTRLIFVFVSFHDDCSISAFRFRVTVSSAEKRDTRYSFRIG